MPDEFSEYKLMILKNIEDQDKFNAKITEAVDIVQKDLIQHKAYLKVASFVIGSLSAIITSVITILIINSIKGG